MTYIESRDTVGLNFEPLNALRITMSVSEDTEVNVYYTTTVNRGYDNKRKLTFTATAGGMKTYILETGSDKGILDKIRIFPADHTGVRFSVCSLEGLGASKLFSDGKELTSAVLPVIRDGNIYYPFDPSIAEGYILNLHFEWDYASKTLTFYGDDGRSIAYTVGSDKAVTQLGTVSLPCEVFTVDGLPMLYMPSFCEALGFDCHMENNYFYIYTQNYEDNSYLFTRPENEWDFTHGHTLGWTMNATYYNTGDSLYVKATDNDTRMNSGKIAINSTAYSEVEVCLSFRYGISPMLLYHRKRQHVDRKQIGTSLVRIQKHERRVQDLSASDDRLPVVEGYHYRDPYRPVQCDRQRRVYQVYPLNPVRQETG